MAAAGGGFTGPVAPARMSEPRFCMTVHFGFEDGARSSTEDFGDTAAAHDEVQQPCSMVGVDAVSARCLWTAE